jgi:hypothetical protein
MLERSGDVERRGHLVSDAAAANRGLRVHRRTGSPKNKIRRRTPETLESCAPRDPAGKRAPNLQDRPRSAHRNPALTSGVLRDLDSRGSAPRPNLDSFARGGSWPTVATRSATDRHLPPFSRPTSCRTKQSQGADPQHRPRASAGHARAPSGARRLPASSLECTHAHGGA